MVLSALAPKPHFRVILLRGASAKITEHGDFILWSVTDIARYGESGASADRTVRQALRPGSVGVSEVGRTEHRDEELRRPHLAGQRVDDRHLLAGIVDERLIAGYMGLAHRRRQTPLKRPVKLTKATIRIAVGMNGPIFLKQYRQ